MVQRFETYPLDSVSHLAFLLASSQAIIGQTIAILRPFASISPHVGLSPARTPPTAEMAGEKK